MVGYLITAGVGLVGILACVIWALVERGRTKDARAEAQVQVELRKAADELAANNSSVVEEVRAEGFRAKAEAEMLQMRLKECRERLAACADPQTVKDWLDQQGEGGPL